MSYIKSKYFLAALLWAALGVFLVVQSPKLFRADWELLDKGVPVTAEVIDCKRDDKNNDDEDDDIFYPTVRFKDRTGKVYTVELSTNMRDCGDSIAIVYEPLNPQKVIRNSKSGIYEGHFWLVVFLLVIAFAPIVIVLHYAVLEWREEQRQKSLVKEQPLQQPKKKKK